MDISKSAHRGWREAYELVLGRARMVVLAEVGPRIISLRLDGGENLLFEDGETLGRGQGDPEWHIYGGHRLWVSPETPQTYAPDNAACEVEIGDGALRVTGPADPETRLQRSIRISAEGDRFAVHHEVANTGDFLQAGSLWALTCVRPDGRVFFPWGRPGSWDLRKIVYWNRWADHGTDVQSPQWKPERDLFRVEPTGEEGKVGTACHEGWIGYQRDGVSFFKTFSHCERARYPDDGCSLEVYTCDRFLEMETLSPLGTICPGESATHEETWLLTDTELDVSDAEAVRSVVGR